MSAGRSVFSVQVYQLKIKFSYTHRKKLRQELLPYSYLKRNESKSAESGVTAPDVQNFMRGEIVVFQLSDI